MDIMQWKYLDNYTESHDKWAAFISQIQKMVDNPDDKLPPIFITPLGHCGFCSETLGQVFEKDRIVIPACSKCYLSKDNICTNCYEEGKDTIFWTLMIELQNKHLKKVLELSKIMLSKIEECKPDGKDEERERASVSGAYTGTPERNMESTCLQNMQ